jgi:hypothetical protein
MKKSTSGKGWFDMPKPVMTPELTRDLQVLKMRGSIDPTRHYKRADKTSATYFQVGTVVEGATEFYSARMTKKERKQTILDELMADSERRHYLKRKALSIQRDKQRGQGRSFKPHRKK